MLARTLRRESPHGMRPKLKPLGVIGLVVAVIIGGYMLLPDPGPRLRDVEMSDAALRELIASHTAPPAPIMSSEDRQLAVFGRALFQDAALSGDGKTACTACHGEGASPAAQDNIPSLAHITEGDWFGRRGRTDSLAAEALHHLENPALSATTRTQVVRHVLTTYAREYVTLFGPPPAATADIPAKAAPRFGAIDLPIDISAHALQTLGDYKVLADILSVAQAERRAPAIVLAQRALGAPNVDDDTANAWAGMADVERLAVNKVFANIGEAFAAYMSTLVTDESAFDRFTARLKRMPPGAVVADALDLTFGEAELAGFKLFTGPGACANCHAGPGFTDHQFHNIGLPQRGNGIDLGRVTGITRVLADSFNCQNALDPRAVKVGPPASCDKLVGLKIADPAALGAFKTPDIRRASLTAPYMHDGRFASLNEVLDYYNEPLATPAIGQRDPLVVPLNLTLEEREALLAFMTSLSSPTKELNLAQPIGQK